LWLGPRNGGMAEAAGSAGRRALAGRVATWLSEPWSTVSDVSQSAEHSECVELCSEMWELSRRRPRLRRQLRRSAIDLIRPEGRPDVTGTRATHRKLRTRVRRNANQSPRVDLDRAALEKLGWLLTRIEPVAEVETSPAAAAARRATFADTSIHGLLTRALLAEPPPPPRRGQQVRRLVATPRAPSTRRAATSASIF
jgi:hypothetical protein